MTDEIARIESLNQQYGIPGIGQVVPGACGLANVHVGTALASADIYLHGAQVVSWQPSGADETLFLSKHSRWEAGRAIRGGIPICFPWFRAMAGNPQAPAHGFVRTKEWQLESIAAQADSSVLVIFSTASDESTLRWWPHEFRALYRVTIGASLCLQLIVTNTGSAPLIFEEALHTYFRVANAAQARVRGLDGIHYLDNTDANREKIQTGDVTFTTATDSAYLNTQAPLHLVDPGLRRTLRTVKQNSSTTVVWNPWQQGAASLADLGDDEWPHMVCVEASNILASAVSLAPGEEHAMTASIELMQ